MKLVFLGCLVTTFSGLIQCDSSSEEKQSTTANNFNFKLLEELKNEKSCLVASPFSLNILLNIALVGAGGETAKELNNAVGGQNLTIPEMMDACDAQLSKLTSSDGNILNVANSVWIQKNFSVNPTFEEAVKNKFHAEVNSVDFRGNSQGTTDMINDWGNSKTNGMIKKFCDEKVDPSTAMMLLNAIYFKGQWQKKFRKEATKEGDFKNHGSNANKSKVMFMHQEDSFKHYSDDDLKADCLTMDYAGHNMSMIMFLPHEDSDVDTLLNKLNYDRFKTPLESARVKKVRIMVPRFEMKSDFNLVEPMKRMGIQHLFQDNADLSGIAHGIKVSKVAQKAVLKFNEDGSEAAAITGMHMMMKSFNLRPVLEFRADHPFIFAIQHNPTKIILFTGVVKELPNSS